MVSFLSRNRFSRLGRYKSRLFKLKLFNNIITISVIGAIGLFILTLIILIFLSRDLPMPDKVQRREGFSTLILDRNGKTVYDIYEDKNRIPIPLSDMPDTLKKATVAIEDKEFYRHQGFDPKGMLRAVFNIITFRGIQGGSTLTQQLVKNVLLTSEKTVIRKIKEFMLAVQIERKYSKDEILQMYLNEAPYGGTMWGIESASQGYFRKHAKDLTPIESAILAGLPQRPSYYSPTAGNQTAYKKRTEEVLRRMREDNYIDSVTEYDLKKQLDNIKFATPSSQFIAPHFVIEVKKQLIERFGQKTVEQSGLKVTTTLDRDLQEKTESILKEELEKLVKLRVSNGAVLTVNPKTGEILAYVGSREYDSEEENFEGKFDVIDLGFRQPGSALKPITYAAAFTKGYTPSSILMDVETHFPAGGGKPDYIPKNYDGKFKGPVQIRYALANSINIPAVKMTALVGIRDILKLASDMGITTLSPTDENERRLGLSLVLGGGEVRLLDLVNAYATFATLGTRNDLYSIIKVEDRNGKVLYEHKGISGKKVIPDDVSYLISNILLDNTARKDIFGLNSYLVVPGKTVSVKTGTTDDKKDNWTVGYTQSIVTGVWVGNNDNTPMDSRLASGVTGAAPIWNRVMREALKKIPDEPYKTPDTVISLPIDDYGGGLPKDGKPTRTEYFIKGTEPTSISSIYQKLKISKADNNKLANIVEIAQGAYNEKDFIVFKENDPTGGKDGKNLWQEGIDNWINSQGDPIFHPPKETSNTNENSVVVRIKNPSDMTQIDSNNLTVSADGRAVRDIKKMELYIDDSLKTSVNGNSIEENLNLDTGIHRIKVKAYNSSNDSGESTVTVGVKTSPNPTATSIPPSLTPTIPTQAPSPTPF